MSYINSNSTIYVSQAKGCNSYDGFSPYLSDNGSGPLKTLEYAIELVKKLRSDGTENPITIALTDDYYLNSPIFLDGIKLVTLESFGERRRIIGGKRIDGWERGSFNGVPCFCATVPDKENGEGWVFTDLFICGERAKTTRFPKEGMLKVAGSEEYDSGLKTEHGHMTGHSSWLRPIPEDLEGIDNIEDSTVNFYHFWIDEHSPVKSYDKTSGRLEMEYLSRFSLCPTYPDYCNYDQGSAHYYLTGVPNTFASPDEWYLDRAARKVYYIPRSEDMTPEDIEAFFPTADKLIVMSGEDIRIRDLELTVTKGDYVSTVLFRDDKDLQIVGFGSDIQSVCWAPGAITFENCFRCEISDCYIHSLGVHAIEIGKGCRKTRIVNNTVCDVSAGGIKILGGSVGEDESSMSSDCLIKGNHIHHCGRRYAAGCGILAMHTSNNEISDNEIHDLEYSGISVGWVWGYEDSTTYGNRIEGNLIYNIGRGRLSDMGGVYLLGKQQGTVVRNNRIHDVACYTYGAWGIYLDEGTSYVTVEDNVVYNTGRESFHLHYGSHNTVRNNIFFGGRSACVCITRNEDHPQVHFEGNIFVTDDAPFYRTRETRGLTSYRNFLYDRKNPKPIMLRHIDRGTEYDIEKWREIFGNDQESIIFSDPEIKGLDRFDFSLSESSLAVANGFKPLCEKTANPHNR